MQPLLYIATRAYTYPLSSAPKLLHVLALPRCRLHPKSNKQARMAGLQTEAGRGRAGKNVPDKFNGEPEPHAHNPVHLHLPQQQGQLLAIPGVELEVQRAREGHAQEVARKQHTQDVVCPQARSAAAAAAAAVCAQAATTCCLISLAGRPCGLYALGPGCSQPARWLRAFQKGVPDWQQAPFCPAPLVSACKLV